MTTAKCGHRKHTPITSEAQQGKFGGELTRRREGRASQMPGITTAELISHLHESKGKNLPARKHYDGASASKGGYRKRG